MSEGPIIVVNYRRTWMVTTPYSTHIVGTYELPSVEAALDEARRRLEAEPRHTIQISYVDTELERSGP